MDMGDGRFFCDVGTAGRLGVAEAWALLHVEFELA